MLLTLQIASRLARPFEVPPRIYRTAAETAKATRMVAVRGRCLRMNALDSATTSERVSILNCDQVLDDCCLRIM